MRLEVLVENEDPVVYPLSKDKITVGSSENCDIILSSEGVSRKHLSITIEGDNFFVVDLGSSNGSYINEERLIPGKRAEFTSFFPVRIGHNILLSLLSDEEAQSEGMIEIPLSLKEKPKEPQAETQSDQTRVISLNDISKARTEKLITTRNEKRIEKKTKLSPPAKKKDSNLMTYLAIIILISGAGYNYFKIKNEKNNDEEIVSDTVNSPKAEIPKTAETSEQVLPQQNVNSDLVLEEDLVKKTTYESLINDIKCATDEEKFLCLFFPGANENPFGVVQVGLTFNVMAEGSAFLGHARSVVKKPEVEDPKAIEDYERLVNETAAYIYLLRTITTGDLDLTKFKDARLSIAIYDKSETGIKLVTVIAIKPETFNKLKDVLLESNLDLIRSNGFSALEVVKKYYTTF